MFIYSAVSDLPFCINFCMWREVRVQVHSLACGCPVLPPPFDEKTVLSPLNGIGLLSNMI